MQFSALAVPTTASIVALALLLLPVYSRPQGVRTCANTPASLLATVHYERVNAGVPAIAAAIDLGGRIVASAADGVRTPGGSRVTLSDRWQIGSLTKAMTATLAARLVQERTIRWNTTVGSADPLVVSANGYYRTVTLEQLLDMRSGLQDNIPLPLLDRFYDDRHSLEIQRQSWATIALTYAPLASPGQSFNYSNDGYVVAGALLEHVTGAPWEVLMRREVFGPLGLTSGYFGPPGHADPRLAPVGHDRRDASGTLVPVPRGARADNPAALGPAGTISMTVTDVASFAYVHAVGELPRSPYSWYLDPLQFQRLHQDQGNGYAMGWYVQESSGATPRILLHTGSNSAWYAMMLAIPDRHMGIAIVTNAGPDVGGETAVKDVAGEIARGFLSSACRM